ncbi:FKBP-type peptidyl-prolyl cis-trans isomerase [Chlamydiales bacterium]|nr:FKBP-type peptidyl-prolyl cis-trans isomerase [Chlamydiales bacterium]
MVVLANILILSILFMWGGDHPFDRQEVINNQAYYKVLKRGSGPSLKKESIGQFEIYCKNIYGDCLIDTKKSGKPLKQKVAFAEEGFQKGVIGMKKGEKRVIYTQPNKSKNHFKTRNAKEKMALIYQVKLMSFTSPKER